jgi:predicted DNA-binding transcriptional regulator YafY
MRPKQLERLMCEHVLIRDGHYPSSQTFRKYFKVSSRTAYRDIHILRSIFKAPVDYDHFKHGFYYTKVGWNISSAADARINLLLGSHIDADLSRTVK